MRPALTALKRKGELSVATTKRKTRLARLLRGATTETGVGVFLKAAVGLVGRRGYPVYMLRARLCMCAYCLVKEP